MLTATLKAPDELICATNFGSGAATTSKPMSLSTGIVVALVLPVLFFFGVVFSGAAQTSSRKAQTSKGIWR